MFVTSKLVISEGLLTIFWHENSFTRLDTYLLKGKLPNSIKIKLKIWVNECLKLLYQNQ